MPRTARKKVTETKTGSKRRSGLSTLEQAEKKLKAAQAAFERQKESLRVAREKLRAKRVAAGKRSSKAAWIMVEKTHNAVARNIMALDEAERKLHAVRAAVKIEQLKQQVGAAELKAEAKVLELEKKLADRAQKELQSAIDKFELRWRKKRDALDAKKVKAATRAGGAKVKSATKKAESEIRAVERKLAKTLNKPKKSVARPGRPKSAGAVAGKASGSTRRGRPPRAEPVETTTTKRRGRPPKAATAVSTAPKRRGRPPKPANADAPAKRRGRPPKNG